MWKSIPNWENYYEINEYGEVRNKKTSKLLQGDINSSGYYRVYLYNNNKKQRFFKHRLVGLLFLPNPLRLPEINHIDGDKSNNFVGNLEWCSRKNNEHYARRTGIKEYKPFKVCFIDGKTKYYEFTPELAEELNITRRTILNYLQKKSFGFSKYDIASIEYL